MTTDLSHNRSEAGRIEYTFVIATLICAISHGGASAQTASTDPQEKVQLYLVTEGGATGKGHIEKEVMPPADGTVAFRDCITKKQSRKQMKQLIPIQGSCVGAEPPWQLKVLTGYITEVKPDGSVVFKLTGGTTMALTADQWRKGFTTQQVNADYLAVPPIPKVGELVGGITYDNPQNFYLIENSKFKEIKG